MPLVEEKVTLKQRVLFSTAGIEKRYLLKLAYFIFPDGANIFYFFFQLHL